MKRIIYIMLCIAFFGVSNYQIQANDDVDSIFLNDQIDLEEYIENMFCELEDDDIVYQVNHGGYLFSTSVDSNQLKEDFLNLNKDAKLTKMTVKQAKKKTKYELIDDYLCGRIELTKNSDISIIQKETR